MAQRSVTAFKSTKNSRFADSTSGEISAQDSRDMYEDVADSFLNITDHLIDEDNMASDSASKVPTQQSVKAFVASQVGITIKSTDAQTGGNVGTGEDTLMGYVMAANLLANNGESLLVRAHGTFAANGNTKTLKVLFGATTLFTKTNTSNNIDWTLEIEIIRTGAATQKCNVKYMASSGAIDSNYSATTENLTSALTLSIKGEGTADNDIVKQVAKVIFQGAGTYAS